MAATGLSRRLDFIFSKPVSTRKIRARCTRKLMMAIVRMTFSVRFLVFSDKKLL